MTARALATAVAQNQSNVKKEADRMVGLGLLDEAEPEKPAGVGPRPKTAYALPDHERGRVEEALVHAPARGQIARGQELVIAGGPESDVVDLLQVLADSQETARAAWSVLAGAGCVIAFDGPDALDPALKLVAMLRGARVSAHTVNVAAIRAGHDLAEYARETSREAHRARLVRDTRHAADGG
jgi:hypothetical protein